MYVSSTFIINDYYNSLAAPYISNYYITSVNLTFNPFDIVSVDGVSTPIPQTYCMYHLLIIIMLLLILLLLILYFIVTMSGQILTVEKDPNFPNNGYDIKIASERYNNHIYHINHIIIMFIIINHTYFSFLLNE